MSEKSFFGALYDLSFNEFVTLKLIKVLYILSLIGIGIFSLTMLLGGFKQGFGGAIMGLILAPLVFIIGSIAARVYMELIIVLFRIADNTHRTVELLSTRNNDPSD